MTTARTGHSALLLDDGRVLVVSGASAELYDPSTGTWGGHSALHRRPRMPAVPGANCAPEGIAICSGDGSTCDLAPYTDETPGATLTLVQSQSPCATEGVCLGDRRPRQRVLLRGRTGERRGGGAPSDPCNREFVSAL